LQQKNKKIIIFLETPRNFKLPLNNENNFKNYLFTLARKKIKKLILNIFFIKTKRNLQLLNLNHESFFFSFHASILLFNKYMHAHYEKQLHQRKINK